VQAQDHIVTTLERENRRSQWLDVETCIFGFKSPLKKVGGRRRLEYSRFVQKVMTRRHSGRRKSRSARRLKRVLLAADGGRDVVDDAQIDGSDWRGQRRAPNLGHRTSLARVLGRTVRHFGVEM
jgi:hypothetical protein